MVIFLLLFGFPGPVRASDADRENSPKKDLFLATYVTNQNPFSGEEVELSYTLFFKGIAPKIRDVENPVHQGIWAEDSTPRRLIPSRSEIIDGESYRSAVIKRMKLIPVQSGRLRVTGYRLLCTIPRDLAIGNESIPDDSLTLAAPDVTLHVKPLPEPKPAGFSGAVGTFTAAAVTDRDTFPAGSPLLLTTTITGRGNFRILPEIPLSLPDGFTRIETASAGIFDSTSGGTTGSFTRTITLQAGKPGTFTFSPVTFTAFDPGREDYATVSSKNLTLTVQPPLTSPSAGNPGAAEEERQRIAPGSAQPESVEDNRSPGLLRLFSGLFIALAAVLLYFLLKKFLQARRPADKPMKESLGQNNARERKPVSSLPELRNKLYTAIKHYCSTEPRGLTRSELKQELEQQGMGETFSKKLFALLDAIDRAEFAPGKASQDALGELRQACKSITEELDKGRFC